MATLCRCLSLTRPCVRSSFVREQSVQVLARPSEQRGSASSEHGQSAALSPQPGRGEAPCSRAAFCKMGFFCFILSKDTKP